MRQDILTVEGSSGLSMWPLKAELRYTLPKMTLGSTLIGTYGRQACILTGVGQHGQVWAVQDSALNRRGEQGGLLGRGGPVPGQEWEGPDHSGVG